MRAVVYGSGGAQALAMPKWCTVSVLCFPHRAEVRCVRCEAECKLDGEKADAERELGRFVTRHRRCAPRTGFYKRPQAVPIAAPSDEWMRAFEARKG